MTITATAAGCSCTITFQVIEPTSLRFKRSGGIQHTNGRPDCGFRAQVNLQPDTVSFHNVEIRELNSQATANGFYAPFNGLHHQPAAQAHSAWFTVRQCIAGQGSPANLLDNIYSGDPGGTAALGHMEFPITWEYRVGTGAAKAFPGFVQTHDVDAAGKCTSSKGGETVSRVPSDPTSSP